MSNEDFWRANDILYQEEKKAVKELFRHAGCTDSLSEAIMRHLKIEHRTVVQSFFRNIAKVIQEYAQTEGYDDRNQASMEWAKKVSKIPFHMPFI